MLVFFKVFFRCPCPALTRDLIRVNIKRSHTRTRDKVVHMSLRHLSQGKPQKHPCTTRCRKRDSTTNALGSGKRQVRPLLRLGPPRRRHPPKKKRVNNLHAASAPVRTPYNIYMSFLFFFFWFRTLFGQGTDFSLLF